MGRKTPVETNYHIPGAPRFALLSDSHNCDPTPILSSLRRRRPQLILITGDFVYGSTPTTPATLKMQESRNAMDLIAGCAEIAPTYLSLGNHEWMLSEADLRLIMSTGAVVLDNRWTSTEVGDERLVIGGLSSARYTHYQRWRADNHSSELYPRETYHVERPQPDLSWLSDFCSTPGFHVLMSHHPEYYPLLRSHSIDLVLSGHAHGGQWRFYNPIKRECVGVWSPGQGFLPRLTSGVVDNRLVISRGLSNTTVIPRLWNPTELIYIN